MPRRASATTDTLVIGSGLAGLWTALQASRHGKVTLVTKREPEEANTRYAQGGVAAVLGDDDELELHVQDTLGAGGGLCRPDVVRHVVEHGPALLQELRGAGVDFSTRPDGSLDLGREGGHGKRRIVHAADRTGAAIEWGLLDAVRRNPAITILDHHYCVDLILASRMAGSRSQDGEACWGAYVLGPEGTVTPFRAKATVLATGGAGKVYLYTTNPDVATGDGVAIAFRAGAPVSNLEFVQFHPTCLFHPKGGSFLITEALRGEGATLHTGDGRRFMPDYDPRGELAPRDVVAGAIDFETKTRGEDFVLLDARGLGEKFLLERFPQVMEKCRSLGLDPAREPIPVVPAAHYMCGGVRTGARGRTDIPRLYAVGEVAHTGLHGANRLASNSLLEALVYADEAGRDVAAWVAGPTPPPADRWIAPSGGQPREDVVVNHNWRSVRRLMWDYVGLVRSDERLAEAGPRLELIRDDVDRFYRRFHVDANLLELRNLVLVAGIVLKLAVARLESRGLHQNRDHPETDDVNFCRESILSRVGEVSWGPPLNVPQGAGVGGGR